MTAETGKRFQEAKIKEEKNKKAGAKSTGQSIKTLMS